MGANFKKTVNNLLSILSSLVFYITWKNEIAEYGIYWNVCFNKIWPKYYSKLCEYQNRSFGVIFCPYNSLSETCNDAIFPLSLPIRV